MSRDIAVSGKETFDFLEEIPESGEQKKVRLCRFFFFLREEERDSGSLAISFFHPRISSLDVIFFLCFCSLSCEGVFTTRLSWVSCVVASKEEVNERTGTSARVEPRRGERTCLALFSHSLGKSIDLFFGAQGCSRTWAETLLINYPKIYVYHFWRLRVSFERTKKERLNATKAVISPYPARKRTQKVQGSSLSFFRRFHPLLLLCLKLSVSSSLIITSFTRIICEWRATCNLFAERFIWEMAKTTKKAVSFTISLAKHIIPFVIRNTGISSFLSFLCP